MLTGMASEQIAIRVPATLLAAVDELVARGTFDSRAAAVRAGIEAVTEAEQQRSIDQAVVEGYRRKPPTELETEFARTSLRRSIREEPW